jgi:alkylation response protein AidB-like acyl-CoA dehydrogenase
VRKKFALMTELSATQVELQDLARRVARDWYAPRAREWDAQRTHFPAEERKRIAELGLLALTLPEEYGGGGRPLLDALIVKEEFAKACPPAGFPVFEVCTGPARVIDLFGTAEQKAAFLPPVASGEKLIAICISEPDAGSAATDASTRARMDGGEVVISGTKRWCSGAGFADQYLVYVRFGAAGSGGRGMGAVLVDKEAPGLSFGPQEELMGHRGVGSADMFFDGVGVPAQNVIVGRADSGACSPRSRLNGWPIARCAWRSRRRRWTRRVRTCQERRQLGKPVVEFQSAQETLARMVVDVAAARQLIWTAARAAGHGVPRALDASVAKVFANEMVKQVTDMAIQLHGGYRYSVQYEIERMHRDAVGWAIAGGTPAIQRTRIASAYLGRRFDQRA